MSWQKKLEERRAAQRPPEPEGMSLASFSPSSGAPQEIADADAALDAAIREIDILEAYRRWIPKAPPSAAPGQTESIMVSCPRPEHPDRNPSAWLNTEKGVYHCGACDVGGDVIELAAIGHGMENYKNDGRTFHRLREAIGEDLGWSFYKDEHGFTVPLAPGSPPPGERLPGQGATVSTSAAGDTPGADVIELRRGDDQSDDDDDDDTSQLVTTKHIDYSKVVESGTFLDAYMRATNIDPAPNEYHLFNGLVALSLVAGRHVSVPMDGGYHPSLYICIVGASGEGKSMARRHLTRTLKEGLPFDFNGPDRHGVDILDRPGSGEVLVKMLRGDHSPGKDMPPYHLGDVKGYLDFDELSELIGKASRTGSVLKDKLLELYDTPESISNHSLTSGRFEALRPFVSLTTSTQPETMRKLMTKSDVHSGFLNRFVFVTGTPKPKIAFGVPSVDVIPPSLKLAGINEWIKNHSGNQVYMTWSTDAIELWTTFFHENIAKSNSDITKRLAFVLKKIFMLMAVNAKRAEVSADDVRRGLEMYEFLVSSFGEVESRSLTNVDYSEMEEEILQWIKSQYREDPTKAITASAVRRQFKSRRWSLESINRVMKALQESGELALARFEGGARKGRPPKGEVVVPIGIKPPPGQDGVYVPEKEDKR